MNVKCGVLISTLVFDRQLDSNCVNSNVVTSLVVIASSWVFGLRCVRKIV